MARSKRTGDRHTGIRVDMWFDGDEHQDMLDTMSELKMDNKSDFIRSAVRTFIEAYREQKAEAK